METLLLDTLEELTASDVKRFKWYLFQDVVEGVRRIPKSRLENAHRIDIVDILVQMHGVQDAYRITLVILKMMHQNDLAGLLEARARVLYGDVVKDPVETPSGPEPAVTPTVTPPGREQAVTKIVKILKTIDNPVDQLSILNTVKRDLKLDEAPQYMIDTDPRGICLIINNELFVNNKLFVKTTVLYDREVKADNESLARVFSWLGFWVLLCKNKKAKEMREILKLFADLDSQSWDRLADFGVMEWAGGRKKFIPLKEAEEEDACLKHGASFVCCLLSHGTMSGIYGSHGEILPYNKLFAIFKCSSLKTKPKMFFIQACRTESSTHEPKRMCQDPDAELSALDEVETDPDMLIAWATGEKTPAVGNRANGSWFIRSLCDQLTRGCARGDDILSILTHVSGEVREMEGEVETAPNKMVKVEQYPGVKSTLGKGLVLRVPLRPVMPETRPSEDRS